MPKLAQNNGIAALDYLKFTESSRNVSSSNLKFLVENRRVVHAERINNNINLFVLKPGDIMMARTTIQSDKNK